MILGLGIDVVENRRVERELARGAWLHSDGVFTPTEIACCSAAPKPARRYAACFAAKEATLKALGVAVKDLGTFRDIEVRGNSLVLLNQLKNESEQLGVRQIHVATTVGRDLTGAMVILEQ